MKSIKIATTSQCITSSRNEGNDSLTWTGPDCINSIGLNNSNVYDIENLDDILKSKTINYDAKELSYFKILLKDEITGNKMILKPENFNKDQQAESYKKDPNSNLNLYPFSSFEVLYYYNASTIY